MNALSTLAAQTLKAQANAKKAAANATKATAKKATAKKPASVQPKTVKPSARVFKYGIVTGRPGSGAALYAYTQAWLEMAGLDKGKAISRKEAEQVAGYTAIAYHIREGRMVEKDGKVSITAGGKIHFKARADKIDSDDKKGWQTVLRTGKPDGRVIKNAACIRTL